MPAKLRLIATSLLLVLSASCGGAMRETESGSTTGGEGRGQDSPEQTDTTPPPDQTAEQTGDFDEDQYRSELSAAVLRDWNPPNRASGTEPRVAVVLVRLTDSGQLSGWDFRRRSPENVFNDSVTDYMDGLLDSSRRFPMPPTNSAVYRELTGGDGVAVEIGDDDA